MSTYWCDGCQQTRDKDFVGYNEVDGKYFCDPCFDMMEGMPEIPTIPKITTKVRKVKSLFHPAPGLINQTAPRENDLADEEKEAMHKRFWDNMEFVELDNGAVDYD